MVAFSGPLSPQARHGITTSPQASRSLNWMGRVADAVLLLPPPPPLLLLLLLLLLDPPSICMESLAVAVAGPARALALPATGPGLT